MTQFALNEKYRPLGDQPEAIRALVEGIQEGSSVQTLLGATGTGKTFTVASVIAEVQRPALVLAPNKTLAAQLVGEFRELFPENAVEYFVSYYDHYQPEAYVPHQDLFIEKDASVNEDIDRLRHAATSALLSRRDTIVVASVSCIYGIGSPENYQAHTLLLREGDRLGEEFTSQLVQMQYSRNDTALSRGSFSWRGEKIEIWPAGSPGAIRVHLWGDEIEKITTWDPRGGQETGHHKEWRLWPSSHWVVSSGSLQEAILAIKQELRTRTQELLRDGKTIEAQRLRSRTEYDLEMLQETGWTSGIENYSAVFDGRSPGEPPATLLDYFPDDFLVFLDESHQSVPQIGGMYQGDRARKQTLIDHGFRLPSALDNRPLRWEEFLERTGQIVCMSATPGSWEKDHSDAQVEQIVRPTGIVDPQIHIRPRKNQMDDLLSEIHKREKQDERVLVTTLTKKMAEDLTEYMLERGIRVRYLHSDVQTLERVRLLRDLRSGRYDVLVGVNLLREGLDLPEVSLVAILDADREGFLRGETALIQTIGRAARHPRGEVLLYADEHSRAMKRAIRETDRRRKVQSRYNKKHGISPEVIRKGLSGAEDLLGQAAGLPGREQREVSSPEDARELLLQLEERMNVAAEELRFEEAASLRDEIADLRSAEENWEG